MTTTLLTHEFRRTRGMLGVIVAAAAVFVLVGAALMATRAPLFATLGVLLALAAVMGLLPVLTLALAIDYWRSAYGRGGYLTHAVPVRGSRIYGARLLYGTLVAVVGLVLSLVLALPAAVAFAAIDAPPGVSAGSHLWSGIEQMRAVLSPAGWALVVLALVLATVFYLVQYYFAASIGSEGRLAALGPGGPILVWFVLYLVTQVLTFAAIVTVPFGLIAPGGDLQIVSVNILGEMMAGAQSDILPLGMIPLFVVLAAVLIWRTAHSWNHKVTLR